jgi:transposase InsO family protein
MHTQSEAASEVPRQSPNIVIAKAESPWQSRSDSGHIDIKYLPWMPDEIPRRYLFVAIDRASRWVFPRIYNNQSEASSLDFPKRLQAACPIRIRAILTDNGKEFTDRFTSRQKQPAGNHVFDQTCDAQIDHRLIPPRHPWTNGMTERFNGRVSELC